MEVITKGFFWFSMILIGVGFLVGRAIVVFLPEFILNLIKSPDYGIYI